MMLTCEELGAIAEEKAGGLLESCTLRDWLILIALLIIIAILLWRR